MPEIEDIAVGAWPRAPAARSCDACAASAATLHCGVCSVFLCVRCDGRVHGVGDRALSLPHGRVWMCAVCEQAPAAVTCEADAAALCGPCDADIHAANPLASRHDRVPAIPFYESAVRHRSLSSPFSEEEEMKSKSVDFIFPEVVDPFLEVDYSPHMHTSFGIIQTTSTITTTTTTTDNVVPEVIQGKIDDASSLPFLTSSSSLDFDHHPPKNNQCYSFTLTNFSPNQSISSPSPCLDVGVVPSGTNISFSEGTADYSAAAAGMDREARVLRYREKRKNRKFEKTIRYASRKAYAESRPRIKGRFAKRTEAEIEAGRIYSSAVAFLAADSEFGVVPS